MTLSHRIVLWMFATLAVLLPVSVFVSSRIVGDGFSTVEQDSVVNDIDRLREILAHEGEELAATVGDWAPWDETYEFIESRNDEFVKANLQDSSIANLRIDVMLFLNPAGEVVHGINFNRTTAERTPPPQSLIDYSRRPDCALASLPERKAVSGLLSLPEGPMIVAAHRILRNDFSGPPRGSVLFGRWLDRDRLARVEKIMLNSVTLQQAEAADLPADFARAVADLATGRNISLRVADDDTISGYTALKDLRARPTLLARVDIPRSAHREAFFSLLNLVTWLVISMLAFTVVVLFSLRRLVLDRVAAIMDGIGQIRSKSDLTARLKSRGTDELARLTESINQMLASLEASEEHQVRVDAALALEKERLAVTLRSIGDGVVATDTSGNVVLMNKVAESLTGWFSDEALGQPVWKIFRAVDGLANQPLRAIWSQVVDGHGACMLPAAALLVSRNGVELGVAGSIAPVVDQQAEIVGAVLVFRDTTDARRLEEERLRANKLESVGLLAGGIAHDFNNALTSVLSNNSLAVLCAHDDQELRGYLADTEKACLRARSLTQQLLTFARGGAPVKKLSNLCELVHEAGGFAVRGTNVLCHFHVAANLWPAEVDEGQIVQVVQNLVINAVQAMPSGGNVHITAENLSSDTQPESLPPGEYVLIEVRDEGPGIPAEHLPRVFDPYFTTKRKGTGLGLATAYSIIRNHGGQIVAQSSSGRGAIFSIYLRAAPDAVVKAANASPDEWRGQGRLLLMDDEEITLRAISRLLQKLGYDVISATDSQSAVNAYVQTLSRGKPFDAVIMDLTVPGGMGGRETAAKLLSIHPAARIIVSSGYSTDPIMSEHEKHGFCAALAKPYSMGDLIVALRTALGDKFTQAPR